MTTKDEALRQAREALEVAAKYDGHFYRRDYHKIMQAITVINAALSEKAEAVDIGALREAITDAAHEWSQYVEVDTAPRTLTKHMLEAFDAAVANPTQQPEATDYNCRVHPHGEVPCDQCEPRATQQPEAQGEPGEGKALHAALLQSARELLAAEKEPSKWGSVGPDASDIAWRKFCELVDYACVRIDSPPPPAQQPAPQPVEPATQNKFDDVLVPFLALMRKELHANTGKGDRPGWLKMDANTALLDVYYHLAKLQKAVKNNDGPSVQEYAADVANMAMMVLDVCGGLYQEPSPAAAPQPADERVAFEAAMKHHGKPEQGWWFRQLDDGGYSSGRVDDAWAAWQARAALSTAPQAREWRELSPLEIENLRQQHGITAIAPSRLVFARVEEFTRAISAALKRENGGGV